MVRHGTRNPGKVVDKMRITLSALKMILDGHHESGKGKQSFKFNTSQFLKFFCNPSHFLCWQSTKNVKFKSLSFTCKLIYYYCFSGTMTV